ncbi:hypothetical protein VAR608DRAFT_0830 [Variovorax sp. HW608]|uniref:hypothetical protein n=1 Tax=Variovorax sp. HW608 TaxID=1034889 RepID=UPI00081FFCFB|nr:hypothetical protein [Variovorax sp. HW608]SCK13867.1 hypothetical protein VAR608DRAFT_0830 [Variovorax sp. HW608]
MSTTFADGHSMEEPRASSFANALSRHVLAWLLRLFTGWKLSAPAAPLTRKAEADAVRDWAWTFAHTDRGFSDDLFAAADRHERAGS